jgi:single-strand DNA-binding protein
MAEGLNKVILLGNLGAEPELRTFDSGTSKLTMRLCTSRKHKNRDGEFVEKSNWHNVVIWGKRAEGLNKLGLAKGDRILVEGSVEYGSYDKDGVTVYTTDINAYNVVLNGRGSGGGGGGQKAPTGNGGGSSSEWDDVPFAPMEPIG